jgi:hypothetical protein
LRIDPTTRIPDLVEAHPSTRRVFDRYGLRGCGGPKGPVESVGYFARAHGVDLPRLLEELRAAAEAGAGASSTSERAPVALADRIYRRFFLSAIAMNLTAGATWGTVLLFRIGEQASFTALSVHELNAHGHVQIFGWVGLFVMGFALQAFPRFRHGTLWRADLAQLAFILMVGGIVARFAGGFFWQQPWALALGMVGSAAEIVAVSLFAIVMAVTLRRAPGPSGPYQGYIAASTGWLLVATVFSAVHFANIMTAPSGEALVRAVALWQLPLREIQIVGFALLMILGVSQRFLAAMYGFPATPAGRSRRVLILLNLALVGAVVAHPWFLATRAAVALAGRAAADLLLVAAVVWLVLPWKLWSRPANSDRGLKFIRAAYAWLMVALLMGSFAPLYGRLLGSGFSHAYFGAARHAITVGFISMMILGVSSKIVPTLAGLDLRRLGGLWPTFLLVNLGCFLRVTLQVATDHWPGAFAVLVVSAVLETAGIALWAVHLARVMLASRRAEHGPIGALSGRGH